MPICQLCLQVKATGKKKRAGEEEDDLMSMTTATDTTETTLVDVMDGTVGGMSSWEVEDMKKENERLREKCDKLEKEKAEILTRRVASLDAPRPQVYCFSTFYEYCLIKITFSQLNCNKKNCVPSIILIVCFKFDK